MIAAADDIVKNAQDGIKLANVGLDEALLASKYPWELPAKRHNAGAWGADLDYAGWLRKQALERKHKFEHLEHKWHQIEEFVVAEKVGFYECKHFGGCSSRQDVLFNPSPHPGGLTGKMVKKSSVPSSGSTYAPVTNPWGGGFFE